MAARIVCPILNGPSNGSCTHTHTHRGLRHLTFEKIKFQFFYFQEKKRQRARMVTKEKLPSTTKAELPIFMKTEKKKSFNRPQALPPSCDPKKIQKIGATCTNVFQSNCLQVSHFSSLLQPPEPKLHWQSKLFVTSHLHVNKHFCHAP